VFRLELILSSAADILLLRLRATTTVRVTTGLTKLSLGESLFLALSIFFVADFDTPVKQLRLVGGRFPCGCNLW